MKAQVSCPNISAIPLPIRAEGVTEQIANLTITCVAPVSATADITLSFSPVLAVTSKVLIPATGATEALAVTGAGSVSGIRSGSSLVFSGIPVGPAASNITITNIRIDATGAALNASVTAQASVSGSGITAGTTNSATVALVQPGLAPQTITGVTNYAACSAITVSSGPAFSIHFGEGFPTAFKTQGGSTNASVDSAAANNTESGYFIASGGIDNQASSATRIKILFANIPSGVIVYVPVSAANQGAAMVLTASEAGPFSAVPAVAPNPGLAPLTVSNGTATAIYEVTLQDPTAIDTFAVPVYLSATAGSLTAAAGSPITAAVSFAPVGAASNLPDFALTSSTKTLNASAIVPCIAVTTASLPNGVQNAAYPATNLTATGGTPGYTWSIISGALPAGLSLAGATGAITGTPTVSGTFHFTVQATDSGTPAQVAAQSLTLTVSPPLVLSASLSGAAVGSLFSASLVTVGTPPFSCSVSVGVLPAGLTLNASTCVLSGIPTAAGLNAPFTVSASNGAPPPPPVSQSYALTVAGAVQIATPSLPPVPATGTSYSATLTAVGGYPPYSNWTISSGSLPNGFLLNSSTGVITGNPNAVVGGPFTFSATVQDSFGNRSPAKSFSTGSVSPATITLSIPFPLSILDDQVTLVADIAPISATGKVTFYDGVFVLGTGTLVGGEAVFTTSLLPSGTHLLRAYYPGSPTVSASGSSAVQLTVLGNLSQGGFRSAVNVAAAANPSSVVAGDFNGDFITDLAVLTGTGIQVFAGNGDGTFQAPILAAVPGLSIAASDFDGDGNTDLAAANPTSFLVGILRGNGDGTFQPPIYGFNTAVPSRIAVADFNGDGIPDLAATSGGGFSIAFGKGDNTFSAGPVVSDPSGGPENGIAVADFNQDGIADIVLVQASGGTSVFLGRGDGTFQSPAGYPGSGVGVTPVTGDFNGDGFIDIATNGGVLPGRGDGTFGVLIPWPAGVIAPILASDFNGDGTPDLIVTISGANGVTVGALFGNGNGTFQKPLALPVGTGPFSAVSGDFNGDGVTDVAVVNQGSANISVVLGFASLNVFCTPPNGPVQVGTAYFTSCLASGGTPPYTWSIGPNTLPPGLTFDPVAATISGTPSTSGIYAFAVTVRDSATPPLSITQSFSGFISDASGGGLPGGPSSSTLSVSPTSLSFQSTLGTISPPPQAIALTSTVAGSTFVAGATTSGGTWLSVAPVSASTDVQGSVNVSVDPSGLAEGNYTGNILIVTDRGGIVSVPVTLSVQGQISVAPGSLSFTYRQGDPLPPAQSVSILSASQATQYAAAPKFQPGEHWLSVLASTNVTPGSLTVSINQANLAAGSYSATIAITYGTATLNVPVALTVLNSVPAVMAVSPATETFNLTQGSGPATGQFTVSNTGGGTLQFSAQAANTPGNWLTLSGGGVGSATPSVPAALGFTVSPAGLKAGLYNTQITIQDTNSTTTATVNVILSVSQAAQSITLSQTALTFLAMSGGPPPGSQSFTVGGQGGVTLNFTAQAQVIANPAAPSATWLSVTPPATVAVNPTGLPVGLYYGYIDILAPNAVNSPQSVSVLLNVAASPNIGVPTGGLIFAGAAGNTTAQTQTITLFNPTNASINYSTAAMTTSGAAWLSVSAAAGTLLPGANSLPVAVDFTSLPPGLQSGNINVVFGDGSSGLIQVDALAMANAGPGACVGGKPAWLLPVFVQPVGGAVLQAAVAQTVQIRMVDDCGHAVTAAAGGHVQVIFGDQDTAIDLSDTGAGIWEGTWNPANTGTQVSLQAAAFAPGGLVSAGGAGITVAVQGAAPDAPAQIAAVVNAASGVQATPQIVAPGSYVAIYGAGLALDGAPLATAIPLPTALNGTQLMMGDQPLPLLYAGPFQVNALIPQSLNPNTSYQLVVVRGSTRSVPLPLTVTGFQPAIYSQDLSGGGQGVIEIAGTALLAAPADSGARPAQRGSDYLSIFCTGLGPVQGTNGEAAPADGSGAPSTTLFKTSATVTATVGGVDAPVVFAGLTPTLVGLYQVNVQVPAGASSGDAVPLSITVTDPATGSTIQSNTVTIAVQ